MKFSEAWLREFVNPALSTQELAEQLTMAGLEVSSLTPVAPALKGLVVAEILKVEAHPDADRLQLCQVASGKEKLQVVCGAPNARVGLKVPLALVGASLPNLKVKKAQLRGLDSFGMLCSEAELGLSDEHAGLMELPPEAPVGAELVDYLGLADTMLDLDLTPNRGDCLSLVGLARETGLMNRLDVKPVEITAVPAKIPDTFPVELAAGSACPRLVGRVIKALDPEASSPLWLKEKLRRSGIRAINPLVDVTHFVMLELGQPLHAYDLAKLQGKIIVRQARPGEELRLLDGKAVTLNDATLLITDASGPIGMAGVMGGLSTGVEADTRAIFLESAFFAPTAIAGRARAYNLNSDAAHRFERGVDWQGQAQAVERATQLLIQIAGGEPGPTVETAEAAQLPSNRSITLRLARIDKLLGVEIAAEVVSEILERLGFNAVPFDAAPFDTALGDKKEATDSRENSRENNRDDNREALSWQINVPSHRFDIQLEADLIEEVSRVFGYNKLPARTPIAPLQMAPISEATPRPGASTKQPLKRLRNQLVARGYFEAITYSFVDADLQGLLTPAHEPVSLANPLSAEMPVMRTTIWTGLLKSLLYNTHRQQHRIRLFETGLCFSRQPNQAALHYADINQEQKLAAVACGPRQAEGWCNDTKPMDFYDMKGDLESILALTGDEFAFVASQHPALDPGQGAAIHQAGACVGHLGRLALGLQQQLELRYPTFLFEIDLDAVLSRQLPQSSSISKFPMVRRDCAVIVAQEVTAAQLRSTILKVADETLIQLKLFDVYQGEGIAPTSKSIALGLTFQHSSRTLKDEEVSCALERILAQLKKELAASVRN